MLSRWLGSSASRPISSVALADTPVALPTDQHQVSAYFQNFPNHRTIIQRMVRVILIFCVVQTVCNMVSCMHSLGLNGAPP